MKLVPRDQVDRRELPHWVRQEPKPTMVDADEFVARARGAAPLKRRRRLRDGRIGGRP